MPARRERDRNSERPRTPSGKFVTRERKKEMSDEKERIRLFRG